MKHITSKLLSLLLCLAMLMSMVPVAYADDTERTGVDNNVSISEDRSEDSVKPSDDETKTPVSGSAVSTNEELATAIAKAADGATIMLGEGEFTTYGNTSPQKSLTFIGSGTGTVWTIGDLTADVGGEGNGDYSFDGCDAITFKNMTLKSDGADYRGFIRINNTVVENCTLEGKTAYWGYTTATFTGCTFKAPEGDYALWDYSTPSMTFNNCTFYISGKGINVYVEAGNAGNVTRTVAVNGCTVDSTKANKAFLNIKNSTQSYDVTFSGTNTVTGLNADGTTNSALYQVEATEVAEISGKPVKVQEKAADGTLTPLYEVKAAAQSTAVAKVGTVEYMTLQDAINAAGPNKSIHLLTDIALSETAIIPESKNLTINLRGHNITAEGTVLLNNGKLQISSTGADKSGVIESTKNVAVAVGNNSKLTVNSGTLKGREGAVITGLSTGATIEIKFNATLIATDNAVISGNGSAREGNPNTITIKGSTFIGGIQSDGYIACGIYAPWNDNVTVSGGTFNITNGAGIVARAGTVKVTGGTFNCTGDGTGWVGDNKNQLPCAALVFDKAANYPALTESSQILVSGGSFSTDPAANGATLASGYVATLNESGMYGVNKANPVAEINGVKYDTLQAAITAAGATEGGATIKLLANINTSSYYEVKGANPVTIDLAGHNITGSGISGLFYVTAKGNLTIKGEGTVTAVEDNGAAMAVWVRSPIAKVTLEGGTYTQQITNISDNHFDLIYVERGNVYVKGGTYKGFTPDWTLNCKDEYYQSKEANIEVTGGTFVGFDPTNNKAEGENTNFVPAGYVSTKGVDGNFVVTEANYVAEVNGVKYETLQAAIKEATKGATVKLLRDTKENVTIDKAMTLDLNGFTLNGGTEKGKPALTITARVTVMDSSEAQTGTIMREDTAENSGVSSHYVIDIQGAGWLTFESGNVKNNSGNTEGKGASLVRVGNDSVAKQPGLVIKGGTFTQNNFIVIKVDRGYLKLYGGTLNSASSYAVENWFNATIKGGTVNGAVSSWTYSDGFNSTLTVEDGTINGDVTSVNYGDANKVAKVEITGGTVTGKLDTRSYDPATGKLTSITDAAKATIKVSGGTFDNAVEARYCDEGYTPVQNSDGKYGVQQQQQQQVLAKIGDTAYYTMDEAFRAVQEGETIVMQRDYTTGAEQYSGNKSFTIDLNGKTWTYTGTNTNHAAFEINHPDVTLTVKNGTVASNSMVGLIPSVIDVGGTITYDNAGLVFEGVTMTANGHSGIETNGNNANDTVTLKNSTLNVPNGFGIYFPSSGTLTIDNSTINAKTMGVQVCAGSLSINEGSAITVFGDPVDKIENDGAIQDGAAISIVNRIGYKGLGDITVTGGTFTAKTGNAAIKAYDWANKTESNFTADKGTVAVSGGTFSSIPTNMNDLCADGYIPVKNEDGYAVQTGTYVASIGTKNFATLADAIDAAKDSDTVTLLADVTEDVTINKSITLDLNGKTLTNTSTGKATISVTGGTVTVKNGNVIGGTSYYNIEVTKGSNANLTLEGVTATAGNTGSSMIDNWGTLTITSGTYTGGLNVVKSEEGSTLTINGGKFTLDYAPSSGYTATILVYGDTTITGGEFIQNATPKWGNPQVVMTGVVEGYTAITKITGGTFTNKKSGDNIFHGLGKATSDNFEVSGGTFNKSISEGYCADGFIPTKNADGTYGVKEGKYVAQVGSKKYETLADAIRLAAKGKTVKLLDDVTENIEIAKAKNFTLDLNGHTINGGTVKNKATITNYGTVTITDKSTAKTGTIKRDDQGVEGETSYYVIRNIGTMTIEQANVVNNSGYRKTNPSGSMVGSSLICNGGDVGATLTINGGTFTQMNFLVVKNDALGTLNVTGGTFTSKHSAIQNWFKANITGGEINGQLWTDSWAVGESVGETTIGGNATVKGEIVMDITGSVKPTLEISGGNFDVTWRITNAAAKAGAKPAVSGGTFSSAVLPEYCADGYVPEKNADGTFGVKVDTSVAEVNGKKYETLQEAIAAAQDGDTVKLLADVIQNTMLTIDKNITLDLNGKKIYNTEDIWSDSKQTYELISVEATVTITGNGSIEAKENDCYTINVKNGNLTIENGTFVGNISAVQVEKGTLTINGGEFKLLQKREDSSKYLINCIDDNYVNKSAVVDIRGGKFVDFDPNVSPEKKVDGKAPSFVISAGIGVTKDADGNFTAVPNMAAQIVDADGSSVAAYAGHYDAIAAAKNGETVILLSDCKNIVTNTINANITIDLNGKTLSVGNNNPFFRTNGEVTIQNGMINSNYACVIVNAYNKLTLKNVKITGVTGDNGKNLVNVCSNAEVTIDKDTVLTASGSGVAVFIGQDADAQYTLNVYGKVIQNSKTYAICGNGSYKGTSTINIYDGAEVKSPTCVAIYQPQAGVTNIYGGLVEGKCAIGIKSGALNISGGTVRGTANDNVLSDDNSNGNGISYDGSAIIVDSRATGYAGNVKINVTGGTVESYYSNAIREIGNDPSVTQLTELTVTGGNVFGASSKTENVTNDMLVRDISVKNVSVSGGTFKHEVQPEYCAIGFVPKANSDGTYGVKAAEGNAAMFDAEGKLIGYADVEVALKKSEAKTVKLIKDAVLDNTVILKNKTLDLNGNKLTLSDDAMVITATNGFVIDSQDGKGIIIAARESLGATVTKLASKQVPLYDDGVLGEEHGYRFYNVTMYSDVSDKTATSAKFWCSPDFDNYDAYLLLASGKSGAQLYVMAEWSGKSGEYKLKFQQSLINQFCNNKKTDKYAALYVKFTGLDQSNMSGTDAGGTIEGSVTATLYFASADTNIWTASSEIDLK